VVILYPQALTLAAWMTVLAAATLPLVSFESKALRIPCQWVLMVAATCFIQVRVGSAVLNCTTC